MGNFWRFAGKHHPLVWAAPLLAAALTLGPTTARAADDFLDLAAPQPVAASGAATPEPTETEAVPTPTSVEGTETAAQPASAETAEPTAASTVEGAAETVTPTETVEETNEAAEPEQTEEDTEAAGVDAQETPEATPQETVEPQTPTDTPTFTETPAETETETATETPTETPTATPTDTATATETPTDTPTPTPVPEKATATATPETQGSVNRPERVAMPGVVTAAELKARTLPAWYTWKYRDDFASVAEKLYGDPDLYPLLVDANETELILPDNVVRGTRLRVPKPPDTDEKLDAVRQKAERSPYTSWLGSSLRKAEQ